MGENTLIGWTDYTFNFWIGCQKVGPGCDHCYAEVVDKRFGHAHWGPHAARRRTSYANWQAPPRWNRESENSGRRPWVFCASRRSGVPVFVKQFGSRPYWYRKGELGTWADHVIARDGLLGSEIKLKSGKGTDWAKWPQDLRVREMPREGLSS